MKKETSVANVISEETSNELANLFPVESKTQRIQLPRLGMFSQDKFEKDGKTAKLVKEAGVFYTEIKGDDTVNEDGTTSLNFVKTEIGKSIEAIILYTRRQLTHYDQPTETYTSSPIYDNDDEVIPLWSNKAEIDRGTPAELQAKYPPAPGKKASSLKDSKIVYVLYEGEVYQMNLGGSSMYSFKDYCKKVRPNTVLTSFNSEEKTQGEVSWNQMSFTSLRGLTAEEGKTVLNTTLEIVATIEAEKSQYAATDGSRQRVNAQWADMTKE